MILLLVFRRKLALQKMDSYSNMEISFLRELAEGINLSFRFHGDKNKDALLKILRRKLDVEKMNIAYKMYLVCYDAKDVVQVVKPKGMFEIVESVEAFFKASEYLYEVTVGSRRCDLVFFSESSISAIEVKSSLDKMNRALDQVKDYKKWANRVYLAYDIKHDKKVRHLPFKENGVGLLRFSSGNVQLIDDAPTQEHDKASLLSLMTYNHLRKISRGLKVNMKGGKQTIAERVSKHLTEDEVIDFFQVFLRTRALV